MGLGGGALLEQAAPLSLGGGPVPVFQVLLGGGLVVLGIWAFVWSLRTFAAARTGIMPVRSASCVVMAGPYRFSRNPMYVSFTTIYVGFALALNLPWSFVLLPGVLVAIIGMVIHREERYMLDQFGRPCTSSIAGGFPAGCNIEPRTWLRIRGTSSIGWRLSSSSSSATYRARTPASRRGST